MFFDGLIKLNFFVKAAWDQVDSVHEYLWLKVSITDNK